MASQGLGNLQTRLDKATPQAIWKTLLRVCSVAGLGFVVMVPQFALGLLTSAAAWNGYKIPLFSALLLVTLNAKRVYLWTKQTNVRRRGSNQHNYHGIPVGELAEWLMKKRAFKRDESIKQWALSQGKYVKIAEELEKHGVLERGDNHARVLRDISMEQLVRQLREDFPLVYSEERKVWAERNGAFERWALDHDAAERKTDERIARKERKVERLDQKINERSSMADVLALCQ